MEYTISDPGFAPPGRYLVRVSGFDEGHTNAGDPMLTLWLSDKVTGSDVVKDRLPMTKKAEGIVAAKLQILGVMAKGQKNFKFSPKDLMGKECIVNTCFKPGKNGRDYIELDETRGRLGYEPADAPPPEADSQLQPFGEDESQLPGSGEVPFG